MSIPEDPFMLLSFVNMKLRDGEFDNLSDFCATIGCDEKALVKKLNDAGFEYVDTIKQFR